MDPDSTICYCFRISRRKVINFIKRERPQHASRISECLGAGTGCGRCIPFLEELHEKVLSGEISDADDLSDTEYERMRQQYLEEQKIKRASPPSNELPDDTKS